PRAATRNVRLVRRATVVPTTVDRVRPPAVTDSARVEKTASDVLQIANHAPSCAVTARARGRRLAAVAPVTAERASLVEMANAPTPSLARPAAKIAVLVEVAWKSSRCG